MITALNAVINSPAGFILAGFIPMVAIVLWERTEGKDKPETPA